MAVSVAPGALLCSSRARGLPCASASPALRRGAHPVCFDPTVYPDGRVCISILHAPGDDPMGYESSAERWSPVQSVEKILLSVVSMLAGKARGHTARRLPPSPVHFAPACGVRTGRFSASSPNSLYLLVRVSHACHSYGSQGCLPVVCIVC